MSARVISAPVTDAWRARGACRRAPADPEDFYAREHGPSRDLDAVARALAVCAECPVRTECRRHALAIGETYGIWGGMTERERRRVGRTLHGTPYRYGTGCHCGPCLDAYRAKRLAADALRAAVELLTEVDPGELLESAG